MQAIHIPSFLPASKAFTALHPSSHSLPKQDDASYLIRITHVSPQQVDLLYARGAHQNNNPRRGHVHPPFILGLDFAGVVERPPRRSTSNSLPRGTPVFGTHLGAFATHLVAPPSAVRPIPQGVSPGSAAALAGGVVAFASVEAAPPVSAGSTVLVTGGPGGLALQAAQLLASRGAKVVVLARTAARAAAARELSVCAGMRVLAADDPNWRGEVLRMTQGKGVELVLDHVGVVGDALRVLRYGGTIVLVGFAGRGGKMENVAMDRVLLKGANIIGFRFGEGVRSGRINADACWEGYLEALRTGAVKSVVDDREYTGLQDIGRAMRDLSKGVLVGKAVVEVEQHEDFEFAKL